MQLPDNHPLRIDLNNEVHARPPEPLVAPLRISYLALFNDWPLREDDSQPVIDLAREYGVSPPAQGVNHYSADYGAFRLKWERHTEFTRYLLISELRNSDAFKEPIIKQLPDKWLQGLPGELLTATNIAIIEDQSPPKNYETLSDNIFDGNVLIGSSLAGLATALTDFRIKDDGFSRLWIANHGMKPWQAGRMVQRLLEIDTYRMMALLALPVAKQMSPLIGDSEKELVAITKSLSETSENESILLERLTRLQAQIERNEAKNHYRFGAAAAYYSLVERRINELREERIGGLQTFREFTQRRLVPAMETCQTMADRQDSLSTRVARATQLLSTRVDMARREQNQNVLESMNKRAELQLRLQSTVEGLSVAAITYYIVGLIGYAAKGAETMGIPVNSKALTAISIPLVIVLVAMGIRSVKKKVVHLEDNYVD